LKTKVFSAFIVQKVVKLGEKMTAVIIDRLIHHSYLLVFSGPSYRLKNSPMNSWYLQEGRLNKTFRRLSG